MLNQLPFDIRYRIYECLNFDRFDDQEKFPGDDCVSELLGRTSTKDSQWINVRTMRGVSRTFRDEIDEYMSRHSKLRITDLWSFVRFARAYDVFSRFCGTVCLDFKFPQHLALIVGKGREDGRRWDYHEYQPAPNMESGHWCLEDCNCKNKYNPDNITPFALLSNFSNMKQLDLVYQAGENTDAYRDRFISGLKEYLGSAEHHRHPITSALRVRVAERASRHHLSFIERMDRPKDWHLLQWQDIHRPQQQPDREPQLTWPMPALPPTLEQIHAKYDAMYQRSAERYRHSFLGIWMRSMGFLV